MSRVGKMPVVIPKGVDVKAEGDDASPAPDAAPERVEVDRSSRDQPGQRRHRLRAVAALARSVAVVQQQDVAGAQVARQPPQYVGRVAAHGVEQSLAPYPGAQRIAMLPSVVRMLLGTFLEKAAKLSGGPQER